MSNQVQTDIQIKSIFQSLDQSKADFTDIQGTLVTLSESDVLYREGEEADSVYLIIHGEIKFTNESLIGDEGLSTANDMEFIGYSEYIDSSVRVSTAVANCETFLLKISNGEIEKLVDRNQALLYSSGNGFSNQEDELWQQWDLLLNGYIFNSPPSVDVIPDKHKHSGNNGNNGHKPDIKVRDGGESGNQEIDSKGISENGSKNGEDISNRETETPHAGLITQQEIDSTFKGKVQDDISVDSFGMIDENKLLENEKNIDTSAHSEDESDRENINSKWNSLFEDNKINRSNDEGSVLDSSNGGSSEEIDYPTIDDIISER